jgi:DNA repair protein RadA/Sms
MATASSLNNTPVPRTVVIFGEVGLAGEIRPVPYGEERLREAAKLGFSHAIAPAANVPQKPIEGLTPIGVKTLGEALAAVTDTLQP